MKLTKKAFLSFLVLSISSLSSFAQNDSIKYAKTDPKAEKIINSIKSLITDRPDATESSSTVGKGVFQIETGALYESYKNNNTTFEDFTFNTTLLRYGLLDNVELRLGWDFVEGVTKVNGNELDNVTSGFSPFLLGMKIDIAEEKNGWPEIAFIGHIFPIFTASEDYRPETTAVDFRFSLSHTLSEKSSLGYNFGAEWANDSSEAAAIYTLAYGYGISDKFGTYVELYGDFPEDNKANHYWDAGLTYLVSPDLQLDIYTGTSITEGQDIVVGLGLSYRLRKKTL